MFSSKQIIKFSKNLFQKNNFLNLAYFKFSEVIPSANKQESNVSNIPRNLDELIHKNSNHTPEEISLSQKLGVDLFLNQHKLSIIENSGFYFNDSQNKLNLSIHAVGGWRLRYLKNMGLLNEYDDIFREFLQNCAKLDDDGLKLHVEGRLNSFIKNKLLELKKVSFNLEVNTIKIRQDYKILRMEIYKNLSVDRSKNSDFSKYSFNKFNTGLAPLIVAHEKGVDHSLALNPNPFILATTMLVRSPMRLSIFNQNLTKEFKIKEQNVLEYVVRFETQMNYSDFMWILPTQNKPSRMNFTKITDFNNILRGNPYFLEKIDLDNDQLRYNYMTKELNADEEAFNFIRGLNSRTA